MSLGSPDTPRRSILLIIDHTLSVMKPGAPSLAQFAIQAGFLPICSSKKSINTRTLADRTLALG